MKKIIVAVLLSLLIHLNQPRALAQQVPFLQEFFERTAEFNRLVAARQPKGAIQAAAEGARKRAEEAFKRGDLPVILEALSEGIALLRGKKWDEREKFLSSLTLDLDRLVVEPREELQLSIVRMYPASSSKAFNSTPTVTFEIVPATASSDASARAEPKPLVIAAQLPIAEAATNTSRRLLLLDRAYWVIGHIEADGKKVGEIRKPLYAIGDFSTRLAELSKTVASIKNSSNPKVKAVAAQVATPDFKLQRLATLTKARSEDEINPIAELDAIENSLSLLAHGESLLSRDRGEVERAYTGGDGRPVPYRVYLPAGYDGTRAFPLVVMLHGALGDERYFFGGMFGPDVIKGEADRRGYILVAPNGLGRFSRYTGPAQDDTFEVVKAVTRDYRVEDARIYLMGHSLGALGVWVVASGKPDLFAAISAISGAAPAQGEALDAILKRLKDAPALVVAGDRDGIAPPERSREMVVAAQKAGLKVTYLESAGADHVTVVASTFPAVLDFFEKNRKQAARSQ
jgi:poly(3-hydroxybutyrate) depolymerase